MMERAKQGKRTCSSVLGYDADGTDSLKINEEEAERVRFIFDNYEIRKNISEVKKLCNEKGLRGKRGRLLREQAILTILTRTVYAGWNLFKGDIYKGDYCPIISVEQFNHVQRIIKQQGKITGRKRKAEIYILPEE